MARVLFWSLVAVAAALPVGGGLYWTWATLLRRGSDPRHDKPGIVLWTSLMLGGLIGALAVLFGLVAHLKGWMSVDCGPRGC